MAFLKSLLLYYSIILFLTTSRSNGLKYNVINIVGASLLNNQTEVINSTPMNAINITWINLVDPESLTPSVISTKPHIPILSRRSWLAHMDYFNPSTLAVDPPTESAISINTDSTTTFLSQQDLANIAEYGDDFVTLPDLPCETINDCKKWDSGAPMLCEEGQCQCPDTLCWSYQLQSQAGAYLNVFSCQECGSLGSMCHSNDECEEPGTCWTDDFCHCDVGVNYYNICLIQVVSFTDNVVTIVLGSICLVLIFAFCCIAYKPNIYAYCWRTCHHIRSDEEDQSNAAARRQTRRLRRHKSPAFTHTEIFRDAEDQQPV